MNSQAFELLKASLDEIRQDMRDMRGEVLEYKEILLRNTITLEDHVRRTNLLQEQVANMQRLIEMFEQKMSHVDKHVSKVENLMNIFKPTPRKLGLLISALTATLTFFTSIKEFAIKVLSGLFK